MTADLELDDARARDLIATALDRTLFVEAGAGTGKTTALVGRIVNMVLSADPATQRPLAQIAAITFTEAAAAELRERIRIEFEKALDDAERAGEQLLAERCRAALADADIAAISTLHSFAQRLLSEFPVEVGVPPRVEVIDEVRSQVAFDRRWSAFLDELYSDPGLEEFIVRAAIMGVPLAGAALRNIAQEFDDNWDRLLEVDTTPRPPRPLDFAPVREVMADIEQLALLCTDASDTLLERIRDLEGTFRRFERATTDHVRLRVLRSLPSLKVGNKGRQPSWGGKQGVVDARERVLRLNDVCEDVFNSVAEQTLSAIARRIAEFTRRSAQERRGEGLLEFHDLLVLAHLLLRTSAEARLALSERYRVLMLDEFQDTDPIQISLALLLASAVNGEDPDVWSKLTPEDGRLFMVGDPKQSIYRFRRANIGLFLEAKDRFAEGSVALQKNYRTVGPIVDAVNALFGEVMREETDQQARYSPLIPTRPPSRADHRPLLFGGPAAPKAKANVVREAEADDVAAIVADVVQNPNSWLINENGAWRNPQLSDVTILLPTRTSMTQLAFALDEGNIPFRADTGTLVYETQEVKNLMSVLAAVDSPSDQIALVAALRSPLYACGDDDLYRWRAAGGAFDLRAPIPFGLEGTVVAEAIEHLRTLHDTRWWVEPSQLLLSVIEDRFAMALPARGRRARDTWRRLRYVVDQARAFSESGGGDLREYLEWTRLQGFDGSRAHEPMLPEPDDDAVRVMTIHGSKGLEFPITIVSGLTTELGRARPVRGEVVWDDDGVMPEIKASSQVRTSQFDLKKELDDEMDGPERERLLYVALTRARDHLAISGHHRVTAKGDPVASHGATIANFFTDENTGLIRSLDGQAALFAPIAEPAPDELGPVPTSAEWRRHHRQLIAAASQQRVVSATAIARGVLAPPGPYDDGPSSTADEDEDSLVREADTEHASGSTGVPVYRRGRAGSAIGSAVHAVLQVIDLTDPEQGDLRAVCEAQAWAESVPDAVDTIEGAVRSALRAPIVEACRTARHWKELFVVVPINDVSVEGYVDLLVETPEGLVVVDYKTDAVHTERDVEAKLAQYSLQGAAYAIAVEAVTGKRVADVVFVFTREDGPIVAPIDDLAMRRDQVLTATTTTSA